MPQKGFTVIESLIVIAIMGLLFAMTVPNLGRFRRVNQLRTAKQQLKTEIQQIKTWSTAVRQGAEIEPDTAEFDTIMVAYGVVFNTDGKSYLVWETWEDEEQNRATLTQTPSQRTYAFNILNQAQITKINNQPLTGLTIEQRSLSFAIPNGLATGNFNSQNHMVLELEFDGHTESVTITSSGTVF
ncbi:MAG TPA: type II secretion system protein [Candidatus Wirthbacteria bacterium]|nr:type II secretion system protein [Candidatus Wirthbacteria bacterium]